MLRYRIASASKTQSETIARSISEKSQIVRMYELRRIIGPIAIIENIAVSARIREVERLKRTYGRGRWRWRKVKEMATVELTKGEIHSAELHWYEAHGVGKKQMKVKRLLD